MAERTGCSIACSASLTVRSDLKLVLATTVLPWAAWLEIEANPGEPILRIAPMGSNNRCATGYFIQMICVVCIGNLLFPFPLPFPLREVAAAPPRSNQLVGFCGCLARRREMVKFEEAAAGCGGLQRVSAHQMGSHGVDHRGFQG